MSAWCTIRKKDRIVAPVHYHVEADRITGIAAAQASTPARWPPRWCKRGLRATLQAPNLITGQKIVALQMMPDAASGELSSEGDVFVVPASEVGGFDSITRSASELLSKINRIDFDRIGKSLAGAVGGAGRDDQRTAAQEDPGGAARRRWSTSRTSRASSTPTRRRR